ncbi:hypothetical protein TWF696_005449 [Orbilia brochopaga]|uniref:Uncharacterized protein n=1 Tax=Orbilia brochopaga TaxID=3140254 RepID=A0AAV9V443_9PEZI
MPVVQHTYGTRRNAPSYPGVGAIPPGEATGPHTGFQSPQEPTPAYAALDSNDSPDLVAARRELFDVEAHIQMLRDNLNLRLNNPDSSGPPIESLEEEIRSLVLRGRKLRRRVHALQNPDSPAYLQSQAMTANPADAERGLAITSYNTPLAFNPPTATRARKWTAGNLACFVVMVGVVILFIVIITAIAYRK